MALESALVNILLGVLGVFAVALGFMAFRAWRYARDVRSLLLMVAFALFLVKVLVIAWAFFQANEMPPWVFGVIGLDFLILGTFYVASLR